MKKKLLPKDQWTNVDASKNIQILKISRTNDNFLMSGFLTARKYQQEDKTFTREIFRTDKSRFLKPGFP